MTDDDIGSDGVQAELDRLAMGPGDPSADVVPRLAQAPTTMPSRPIPPPRVSPPAAVYGGTPSWKRRRRRGRRFLSFLFVLGLVGGGLYVARQYMLDKVVWDRDVAARADLVAAATGLEFTDDVAVVELPFDEFVVASAERLASSEDGAADRLVAEWRALGLASGRADLTLVAAAAAVDSPAYYDAAGGRIVIVADLGRALKDHALDRALVALLLDQHRDWVDAVEGEPWSVAVGTRALVEAVAVDIAQSIREPDERAAVLEQMLRLAADERVAASPSAYGSVLLGRLGAAAWPLAGWARASAEAGVGVEGGAWLDTWTPAATVSDVQVLDAGRLLDGAVESPAADSRGALFWYHVLAARLDDDRAWTTSLLWHDDRVTSLETAGGVCVTGEFSVLNRDLDDALATFEAWAASAPPESITTVRADSVSVDLGVVSVSACDPGVGVPTNDGSVPLSLGGAPLRSEQFRTILTDDPSRLPQAVACQVWSAGDALSSSDERGVIDGPDGWSVVTNHGDPREISLGNC